MRSVNMIVIAKSPCPGVSKTRLIPALGARQAAAVAEAALTDTLKIVAAVEARRRILVLEGAPGRWLPPGFEVVPQAAGGLARRLEAAFAAIDAPSLLIGMDTPQLSAKLLEDSASALISAGTDAVIGSAEDGGYWLIGLRRPFPNVFRSVPMSSERTFAAQVGRFAELGLRWVEVPGLRDVDTIEDALAVAAISPGSRFAAVLAAALGQARPSIAEFPTVGLSSAA